MDVLEGLAGGVLGLGLIVAVFWITFRRPPRYRGADSTTTIRPNSDADYFLRNDQDGGSSTHF